MSKCPECGSLNTEIFKFYAAGSANLCMECDHDWDLACDAVLPAGEANPQDHGAAQ